MLFVLQETLNRRDKTNLQKVTHLNVNILHRINSTGIYNCVYLHVHSLFQLYTCDYGNESYVYIQYSIHLGL